MRRLDLIIIHAMVFVVFALWRGLHKTGPHLKRYGDASPIVFEVRPFQLSHDMLVCAVAVLGFAATAGLFAGMAVTHYHTLLSDCLSVVISA